MKKQTELSSLQSYAIGAFTGLAEVLVTNPFFIMKTNLQQGLTIPWRLTSLYKGAFANALGFVPITSIQIGASQWMIKNWFSQPPSALEKSGVTFAAGALSSVVSCPIEKIMTLENNMPHLSFRQTLKYQFQVQGLKSLFSGQMATLFREGGFAVFFLTVTPILKAYLHQHTQHDTSSSVIAGLGSGIGATLVTQPLDTIKTTQQASSSPLGFFKTAQGLGPAQLFKGSLARGSSVMLSITLMSMLKEQLEDWTRAYNDASSHQLSQ